MPRYELPFLSPMTFDAAASEMSRHAAQHPRLDDHTQGLREIPRMAASVCLNYTQIADILDSGLWNAVCSNL